MNRNHIGDCVLTTPLLRALKRRFPEAKLVVSIPASNGELLSTNPHVDEILVRPKLSSWGAKVRFAVDMRRHNYDLIISLQEKSMFYAWATWYTTLWNGQRPVTVVLHHKRTHRWYQHSVPVRADQHEVHKYLGIATTLDCPRERNPVLELTPTCEAREYVEELLGSNGFNADDRFIGINPGGSTAEKRWPPERFARTADRLHQETGLPIMIFGGPSDHRRAAEIARLMTCTPLVVAGRASLGHTAALLERCRMLVTGDTGPMHMAVAMAVPVVALFGPTNPIKFGPFTRLKTVLRHEMPCAECAHPCLHTITAEECVEAALQLHEPPPPRRVPSDRR
ncbi:MAG: glycosyltransferase family 9 protein [Actinomycetota bacterium]